MYSAIPIINYPRQNCVKDSLITTVPTAAGSAMLLTQEMTFAAAIVDSPSVLLSHAASAPDTATFLSCIDDAFTTIFGSVAHPQLLEACPYSTKQVVTTKLQATRCLSLLN